MCTSIFQGNQLYTSYKKANNWHNGIKRNKMCAINIKWFVSQYCPVRVAPLHHLLSTRAGKNKIIVQRITMKCLIKAKTLSLHIRAVGHWTNSLYQYFEKEQAKLEGTNVQAVDKRSRLVFTLCSSHFFPGCEKQSAWQKTAHAR